MSTWVANEACGFVSTELPSNRLRCVIKPTDVEDAVRVQIKYSFGSNAERGPNERGLAHAVEHMIFKGTFGNDEADDLDEQIRSIKFSERDIPLIARAFGSSYNAFTTTNMTSYYFEVAPEFIKPFLQILASSMDRTRLAEQHFKSEKLAILEEMYSGKDDLLRDAIKSMRKQMYRPSDPCYHPTIGYETNLVDARGVDLRGFYDRLYHPENATLFVVGKVDDLDRVKTYIEQLFMPIRPKTTAQLYDYTAPLESRGLTPVGAQHSQRLHFHTLPQTTGIVVVAWKHQLSDYRRKNRLRNDVPKLLSKIMTGDENSRLYKEIVVENNNNCTCVEMFSDLDYHVGETYVILTGDQNIVDDADQWTTVLQRLVTQPLTTREVQIANAYLDQQRAERNIDLESYASAWIDDHHMSQDFSTFISNDVNDLIINDTESFLNEAFDSKPFVWTYTAFQDKDEAKRKAHDSSNDHGLNVERLKRDPRTAPLERPHALPLFEQRYRKVDLSKSLPNLNARPWGKWSLVQNPAYEFGVRIGLMPLRHEALGMAGTDMVLIGMVHDLMSECFQRSKFQDDGVFTSVFSPRLISIKSLGAATPDEARQMSKYVEVFATALDEEQAAALKLFWRRNLNRFQKQWSQKAAEMSMDAETVCYDYVESKVCDSKYASLADVKAAMATFDIDDAIRVQRKWWTEVSGFVMMKDDKYDRPYDDQEHQHVDAEHLDAYLPAPRTLSHSSSSSVKPKTFTIANVPLNQTTLVFGKPGTLVKSDVRYDGVRQIAQHIMFASLGSRFMKHMREGTGNVYFCSGWYGRDASFKHKGYDGLVVKTSPNEAEAVRRRVEAFIKTSVTLEEGEVVAAKRYLVHGWKQALEESALESTWARRWRQNLDEFNAECKQVVKTIMAVTRQDVERFINAKSSVPYDAVAIGM